MQHLSLETLARLLDEPGAPDEAAHLEVCAVCRAELDGLRRQSEALHRLGPIEPPPAAWDELETRLVREALIAPLDGAGFRVGRTWTGRSQRLLRIAAALALYAAGAGTMLALRLPSQAPRVAATGPSAPTTVASAPSTTTPSAAAPAATTSPATAGPVAGTGSTGAENVAEPRLTAAPQSGTSRAAQAEPAATPEEALAAVHAAEREYMSAYARYAELSGAQQAEDPVTRVAALESIVLTTREALDRAPADPVINGYHLTAVAQRDAALRQIALRSNGPWF